MHAEAFVLEGCKDSIVIETADGMHHRLCRSWAVLSQSFRRTNQEVLEKPEVTRFFEFVLKAALRCQSTLI